MGYIDLSRVDEGTLDTLLVDSGIDISDMGIHRKILEYTRTYGTADASRLYVSSEVLEERSETELSPLKRTSKSRLTAGKHEKIDYEGGTIESWDKVSIAKIRSNDGIFSIVHGPSAFEMLYKTFMAHRTDNDGWSKDVVPYKIEATCPTIPKIFERIKQTVEDIACEDGTLPEGLNQTWIAANARITVSRNDFENWYALAMDYLASRGITPEPISGSSPLEISIRQYLNRLESGDFDMEQASEIANVASTAVSIANQVYKSRPPSWKRELIARVQSQIKSDLENNSLDLYNRISKTRFTQFLKDHGISFDDIYEAVVKFKDRFGLDGLIPFIKYDTAETSGNESGIDYSAGYITDLTIKPKAHRVVYREEVGFKAEFHEDFSFESNFQLMYDADQMQEFYALVQDIYGLIENQFVNPDPQECQRYETRLALRTFLNAINNLNTKEGRTYYSFNEDDKIRNDATMTAFRGSYEMMEQLLK